MIDFSIIIPFRGDGILLKKLLHTIPDTTGIQVIVADNNNIHYDNSFFDDCRPILLIPVEPKRGAGGSRNEALKHAEGKWIIFADADDYFADCAFEVFSDYIGSTADLVYFKSEGININTGKHADRADYYSSLIDRFLLSENNDSDLRYRVGVPWGKMYKRTLIEKNSIVFDEIVAGNDAFFSHSCGFYSKKIEAINKVLYYVTVSEGSLTQRKDSEVIKARFFSRLHCNQFFREHGLANYQYSIMYFFIQTGRLGIREFFGSVKLLIKYKQNPFVGFRRWKSYIRF